MDPSLYGPVQQSVSSGVSQLFDYGIGMTALALFLLASVALNIYYTRFFVKLLPLLGEIKEALRHVDVE